MVVGRSSFWDSVAKLQGMQKLSLDTETTGLKPYKEDRLFSLILGFREPQGITSQYWNFWPYESLDPDLVLGPSHLRVLKEQVFSDPGKTYFIHNAKFDMHFLGQEGIELAGAVYCTKDQGRIEYNEHFGYSLDDSLKRIGLSKDDKVKAWIEANNAWEWVNIPGKKTREKKLFFNKVPWDIIVPYGKADAEGCFALGEHLQASQFRQSAEYPQGVPDMLSVSAREVRLVKTVYRMERVGVKIDRRYCEEAAKYERDRAEKSELEFRVSTGRGYVASPKLFADIFAGERELWSYTEKGNPSFESDVLKRFSHPAAKAVLTLRDAKSKSDFYSGFLWHADKDDVIHPNFNISGTVTGRFSSSEPNLQNMTSEEASFCRGCKESFEQVVSICPDCASTDIELKEFLVRRAIVPRPGYVFALLDYRQQEYFLALDYAKHMMIQHFKSKGLSWDESFFEVANKVKDGFDVHKATAEMMGVSRRYAKTLNFMLLFGGGSQKLADALGISLEEAQRLKTLYFKSLPYVQFMVATITDTVKKRGWLRNWSGRKLNFPDRNYAYKGLNSIVQGGCADITKEAMNQVDALFQGKKSRLVLSVHDELVCELAEDETPLAEQVRAIMEGVYPYKHIQMRADLEWSRVSLADKQKVLA